MAVDSSLVLPGRVAEERSSDHRFFTGMALASALLATIALLTPAIARFRFFLHGGPPVAIVGTALFVLVCLGWDRAAHGRIHPAFLWGGLFLIVSLPVRFAIGQTAACGAFAEWLTG
jgi:hypothetical protein